MRNKRGVWTKSTEKRDESKRSKEGEQDVSKQEEERAGWKINVRGGKEGELNVRKQERIER